jgi:hypothetical protein
MRQLSYSFEDFFLLTEQFYPYKIEILQMNKQFIRKYLSVSFFAILFASCFICDRTRSCARAFSLNNKSIKSVHSVV